MKAWLKNTFADAAWVPAAVVAFIAFTAKAFNVYILYPWLDMPTHFIGGAAIAYFFLATVAHSQKLVGAIPRIVQLACTLGLTAITAVIWEFLEHISDVALGTNMNLGVSDTLFDLLFGLLGGAVMIVFAARSVRFGRSISSRAGNGA